MGGLLTLPHFFSSKPDLGKSTTDLILLDYDYPPEKAVELFSERWPFASKFRWPIAGQLKRKVKRVEARRTYHGLHIYLQLKMKLPDLLLTMLQSALGSDFRREALDLRRIIDDTKNDWDLLYLEKWKARRDGYELRSQETPDRRLTRKLHRIIFQRRRANRHNPKPASKYISPKSRFSEAKTRRVASHNPLPLFRKPTIRR